jgi:GTP-binding protein
MFISSVAQQGLTELKDKLWKMLNDYIIKKTVSN